jgi:hypothetical protein
MFGFHVDHSDDLTDPIGGEGEPKPIQTKSLRMMGVRFMRAHAKIAASIVTNG